MPIVEPNQFGGNGGSLPRATQKGQFPVSTGAGAFSSVAALLAGADGAVPVFDSSQAGGLRAAAMPGTTVVYVSPNGSDARDGYSFRDAKQTLAAAAAALPAQTGSGVYNGGGTVLLDSGPYDVYNGGLGLVLDRTKPTIFKAAAGNSRFSAVDSAHIGQGPRIYSSGGAIANGLINSISPGGTIPQGGGFDGLIFDLTDGTPYAVYLEDWNFGFMRDCSGIGVSPQVAAQYLFRLLSSTAHSLDASYWRIIRNYGRDCAIYLGNSNGANCNQNVVAFNNIFYGAYQDAGLRFVYNLRLLCLGNNVEAIPAGGTCILATDCFACQFIGDGGEGSGTTGNGVTFLKAVGGSNNVYQPIGVDKTSNASDLLVDSSGDSNPSVVIVPNAGYGGKYAASQVKVVHGSPVITNGGVFDGLRSVGTAVTMRDTDSTMFFDATVGAIAQTVIAPTGLVGKRCTFKKTDSSANTVTLTPASGKIDGATSYVLSAQYKYVVIESDGTNWQIVANN